jgi:hypothetical protein
MGNSTYVIMISESVPTFNRVPLVLGGLVHVRDRHHHRPPRSSFTISPRAPNSIRPQPMQLFTAPPMTPMLPY